jgi:hypothetical protein
MVCYHVCLFLTMKRGNVKKGENTEQPRNRGAGSVNLMTAHQCFQIEPNSKPATLATCNVHVCTKLSFEGMDITVENRDKMDNTALHLALNGGKWQVANKFELNLHTNTVLRTRNGKTLKKNETEPDADNFPKESNKIKAPLYLLPFSMDFMTS